MAQLHLAFRSPVAAVESQDKRKLTHQLRELSRLTVLIRQLEVGKLLANSLVHREVSPLIFAGNFDLPQANIAQACQSRAKTKAAYRFF
jgi:hypothetical protein